MLYLVKSGDIETYWAMLAAQVSSPAHGEVDCTRIRCSVDPGVIVGVGISVRISFELWISGWISDLIVRGRSGEAIVSY